MKKKLRIFGYILILIILSAGNIFAAPNARIAWKFVNLRGTPTEDSDPIIKLVKGAKVTILKEKDGWYQIESEEEMIGWVAKNSLKLTAPLNLTPATSPKPDPVVKEQDVDVKQNDESGNISEKKPEETTKEEPVTEKEELSLKGTREDQTPESYLKPTSAKMPEPPSLAGAFFRMLSALFIILALILILYYVIKKYFSRSLSLDGGSAITVLASKYIGQKMILYIIDVMEKIIVVAVSGTDIKVLTEISDPASIERMRKDISALREHEKPFRNFFSDNIKTTKSSFPLEAKDENFDILDDINEKLEKKVEDLKL